ncbi:ParE toxin of type II toxin-antitoxin system, parDE [Calidithermus terrae]|uniref:ParE toxin of type II toxin-antitoxin system, parDE n=1 Tax=Calidithermus terrae TaxID=1408545 RepID=A0A399E9T5_9DEIN|nr:type II toxin-antitoxin system RelE/ParE family toxin [Calidithermus terrae]RIH81487.1 ParE toxin of type II toxin-antitoxin system, parDE [Calidithermus terrae]
MAKINWTLEAERWLEKIHAYVAARNPEAATKLIFGFLQRVEMLESFPEMGYSYRSESDGEIRVLVHGHYKIAYLLKSSGDIDVLGIFHGSMEIEQYLE